MDKLSKLKAEIAQIDLAIADGDFSKETIDMMSTKLSELRDELNGVHHVLQFHR